MQARIGYRTIEALGTQHLLSLPIAHLPDEAITVAEKTTYRITGKFSLEAN